MYGHVNGKRDISEKVKVLALPILLLFLLLTSIMPLDVMGDDLSVNGSLYLIKDQTGKGIDALEEIPVELYLRIPPYYIISAPFDSRASIEKKGFEFHEIGALETGKSLFLLSRPHALKAGSRPSAGKVLYQGDDWFLVKGEQSLVPLFGEEEFEISHIPLRPLPLKVSGGQGSLRIGEVHIPSEVSRKMASSDSTIGRYIQRLQNFQTRYSYTDSVVASAEWIYDKFVEFGFTDVAYDSFWFDDTWQRNVVATKAGSVNPDKVIVIGGHYDSVTYSGQCDPMTWAPGADDNASGTALTLDMARVLAGFDSEITLIFVPFAAEEQGLHGSWHFAEEAFNSGMDIRLMINMDMMGWVPDPYLNVAIHTDTQSRPYAELMSQVGQDSTTLIPQIGSSGGGSDHFPFMQYGYNHVYIEEGDFNFTHWHQCSDSLGNLDVQYMEQIVDMILPTIILVANAPSAPTGLVATDHGDGERISLDWDANIEPDIWGYHVFSGPSPGEYNQVDTSLVNSFTLEGLTPEESLYVAVSAIDNDGYESVKSDPVGTIPLSRPRAPSGLDATSYSDRIGLSWDENTELDLAGYSVMQGTRGGWDFYEIASLPPTETTYIDSLVDPSIYYLYFITAFDTSGMGSDPSEIVGGRLATHDRGILVIDATFDGTGGPFSPTDEEVDLFYESTMVDFNLTAQWNHPDSLAIGRRPMDADMAIYSTVVLHWDSRLGDDLSPDTLSLAKYLDNGGNLLVVGWSLLTNLAGGQESFLPGSFFYDYLKIGSFILSQSGDVDFIGARGVAGEYPDISIDVEKVPTGALFNLNLFDDVPIAGEEIYTYISSDSSSSQYHGMGSGLEYIGGDFGVVVLNFPLYYMDSQEAYGLVSNVMTSFGEGPALVEDGDPAGDAGLPRVFSLSQNYPNPFNPSTTISFAIPAGIELVPTRVTIYDVRGRLVKRIMDEEKTPGYYRVHWNGQDERGVTVSSGVYIYTITAGDYRSSRKMVIVR